MYNIISYIHILYIIINTYFYTIREGTILKIYNTKSEEWYRFKQTINTEENKNKNFIGIIPKSYVILVRDKQYNPILDRKYCSFEEFYYLMINRIDKDDTSVSQDTMIKKLFEIQNYSIDEEFYKKFPFPLKLLSTETISLFQNFNKFILLLLFKLKLL